MSVLSKAFCNTGGIPQMQLDPPEGGKFIPEKETAMTDITRKLELLANLKPGEMMPPELGDGNWALVISGICAETLTGIEMLKRELREYIINHGKLMGENGRMRRDLATSKLSGNTPTQVIIDDPQEPAPEPWGSAYAMNTENWK